MDATKGLVVLPFSGWDYDEPVQQRAAAHRVRRGDDRHRGAAKTHGWVERGIFVNNRLVSLSATCRWPSSTTRTTRRRRSSTELTLARNVVTARPQGATIAETSSDWWDNDMTHSEVRVLPTPTPKRPSTHRHHPSVKLDGVDAKSSERRLTYVVTNVQLGGRPPCRPHARAAQAVALAGEGRGACRSSTLGRHGVLAARSRSRHERGLWWGWGW